MLRRTAQDPCSPRRHAVRRLPRTGTVAVLLGALLLVLGLVGPAAPAGAQDSDPGGTTSTTTPPLDLEANGFVAVVKVSGLLDPVLVDFVNQSIDDAEAEG